MIIVRRFNYCRILLGSCFNGESIGIYRKDGSVAYKPFLGFAMIEDARENKMARRVRLEASGYYLHRGIGSTYLTLAKGEYIVGCLTSCGVYCVVEEGKPKITLKGD